MWYIGIANVTTNSVEVIGDANVDFVNNVEPGDAFISTGNGLTLEVLRAESRNKLVLARPYTGPTGSFAFSVQPTQDFNRVTANAIIDLRNTYGGYRDTILQGMFPAGSMAAPGVRFVSDQDTGITVYGPNLLSAVAGGVERMRFGEVNSSLAPLVATAGVTCQQAGVAGSLVLPLDIYGNVGGAATMRVRFGSAANGLNTHSFIEAQTLTSTASDLRFGTSGVEQVRIDSVGSLLVGVAAASNHVISRGTAEGDLIMQVQGKAHPGVAFFSAASGSANGSACTFALNKNSQTGRSINAAGTINGSGADYAEYMLKAAGCGLIAKGDVCGVDRDGRLTKTWADAISFVVKSTDPSLVGGDTWAAHLPPRPEAPGAEPEPPVLPTVPEETADDAEVAAYRAALAAYPALVTQYKADHDAWEAATAAYERDLPAWQDNLEAARICVDRIAFCGQVPCNVTGDFEVGDYIVAVANGAGIKAVAMKLDDMTVAQYARRIGKVWAIRDGRAWIDVQHG